MAAAKKQLIVFDFDWSLADQDTDRWVVEVLAPHLRRKMKTLKDEIQWTDLVAQSLRELHAEGKTKQQIEDTLKVMPFHPAMIRGVRNLKSRTETQTTLFILSNSNAVYINTILEDKGISDLFDEIVTNPAEWAPSGLLQLRRRIDPNGPQHKCTVGCSPNMCKGDELDAFLARKGNDFDRIVYVGDGSNDFCPIIRLRTQDIVLCRKYRGLEQRIAKEGASSGLVATIKYWAGAWEAEEYLDQL